MLRSMYSAISGMQAFETKLDVVGNNIANVNTYGFKAGRVDFSDVLSQTISGSTAPTTTGFGGMNAKQIGLGVQVAGIQTLFTQGADQTTGNPTDMAIDGSGLFIVSPNSTSTPPTLYYSRAGNFTVDSNNNLVNLNGQVLMGFDASSQYMDTSGSTPVPVTGLNSFAPTSSSTMKPMNLTQMVSDYQKYFQAPPAGSTDPNAASLTQPHAATTTFALTSSPDLQIGNDGTISANVAVTDKSAAVPSTQNVRLILGHIGLANFSNPGGLEKTGDSLYQSSANSGPAVYETPGLSNSGTLHVGALEMSNVDLTREFTEMIVAQRGFDANSKMIGTDNSILQDIVNLKNS